MKKSIFDQYVNRVCKTYEIDKKLLFSRSLKRNVTDARQLLYYLCYNRPMKKAEIIRYMSSEGLSVTTTTITHGVDKVSNKMQQDSDYEYVINDINSCVTL